MSAANFQALPHSEESERAVLACILLSPSIMPAVAARLVAEDFYLDKHQAIFEAMSWLSSTSQPVDLRMLQARLEQKNSFELVGGLVYLTGLDLFLPDLGRVMHYVGVVKDRSVVRRLIKISSDATAACLGGVESTEIIAGMVAEVTKVSHSAGRRQPRQIYLPAIEMAQELRQQSRARSPFQGFFTGLPVLDGLIVGLERKTLSLWIADPGAGKTAWSLQVAEEVNRAGYRVFYGSLEMSERALVRRMACRALGIPIRAIARGDLSDGQLDQIDDFADGLSARNFVVDDATRATTEFATKVRAAAAQGEAPDLLVFDYVQIADPPETSRKGGEDWKANGRNCEILRAVAVEVDAHILVLGQANEKGLLRGGGGWHEADLMVRIERPWTKTRDESASPEERAAVVFATLKNRLGGIGDVAAEFNGEKQSFREPEMPGGDQLECPF
jgi:replicative DNA helicase